MQEILNNIVYCAKYSELEFKKIGDDLGSLIAIEGNKSIPFEIKRVYYIFNTGSDVIRGKHAHKNLEQVLICVSGSCTVTCNDGTTKASFELNNPSKGLHIKDLIWREMFNFSPDCVLLCLASNIYDESDYIRNYNEFLEYANAYKQ